MTWSGRYITKDIAALDGGLNSASDPSEINDNEMADCENYTVDDGIMISAPGYVASDDNPLPGPYYAIYHFKKSDGTSVLIRQRQDKLEYSEDQDTFFATGWTECTLPTEGSPAATVTLQEIPPTFATLNDTVVFTNGKNTVMSSTDGKNWTLEPTLPKAYYVIDNGYNRLIFGRTDVAPSIIWWSDINDPTTVGSDSWQFINPNDGERVWGLGKAPNGALIVFKTGAMYSIDDVSAGSVGVMFIGKFKLAHHLTICTTEDSIICGGWDGIYELQESVMRLISGHIIQGGINLTLNSELWRACYFKNEYHIAIPTSESQSYNAQEYVVFKRRYRNDSVQPYVITRNARNIGAYCHVDDFSVLGRSGAIFMGDSQGASGSPASGGTLFAWINSYRQANYSQGLAGSAQTGYFTTKFFTEGVPYYLRRLVRAFVHMRVENETTFELGYRFQPYGSWITVQDVLSTGELEFLFEDGSTGGFSEGYGFSLNEETTARFDLESPNNPRGVQFRIKTSQINDVKVLGLAYKALVRPTKIV